ncbi:MAG TPA: IS1595 family transposase [Acidimicrobiales bacterium]|nr:IS1595 family transposase [Acidimicrobiales bacterium]
MSVLKLAERIPDEASAYRYLEGLRWDDTPVCGHCGSERVYFLTPKNGTSRKTRTGAETQRRLWKCSTCRKQFSVLTNTIMHGTKIPVRTWVFVLYEMASCKNGVAAREIERRYDLTPKSAWFLLHRIRAAMDHDGIPVLWTGTVQSDETWIGGKPANRHGHRPGKGRQGVTDKTPVVALVSETTGEARSRVVPNVTGATLARVLAQNVDPTDTTLVTDESNVYFQVGGRMADHRTVNHKAKQYVDPHGYTTNSVEGFFSQVKRSLDGTHHHVSVEHLNRYLGEFDFRYSTRKMTDAERTEELASRMAGRRLSYRPLVSARRSA